MVRECLFRCVMLAACLGIVPELFTPRWLYAQRVHAVVVGDISPATGFGKFTPNVVLDVLSIHGMLTANIPERELDILNVQIEEDSDSDPKNVLGFIRELQANPSDIIFFYFSGHGGSDDQGHYFALAKGKLYRKQVLDAIASKGPRLTVVITDCCNLRSDGYRFFAPAFQSIEPKEPSPLFRSLLFDTKGVVDINSSSPGEGAFFTPFDEELRNLPGSIFTKQLAAWVERHRNEKRVWDELVRGVSLQVHTSFRDHYPKGAESSKGKPPQLEQTVYPIQYPGMPESKGPRTGFVVRDFPGRGAVITEVERGSPASQVFVLEKDSFVSLRVQQVVVSVNGQAVENADAVARAIAVSPQIARLSIRDASQGMFDILIRMRY